MSEYGAEEAPAESVTVAGNSDVVTARQMVRTMAQQAGLPLVQQTKLVTAASELGRNMVVYGKGGVIRSRITTEGSRKGVWVEFQDEGPGIPDVDLALTDGWTSGGGMGLGLSGARRLVDKFDLETGPRGTTVRVVKWNR
ncbi:ATP-binding protein [Streptomyces sp. NPDC016845]|uniref:ATP-binding protein n=1 Tax=Streptomyces sp. NPDC016845 TaxID=3364972 RepID=UPI0037986442